MNGITGASTQTGSAAPAPYNPADVTDLKATGFAFKDGGLSWDQWIDAARTSLDPQIRAQFQELVDLAGGRTHDAAIMDVMARVAAMQQAAQPGATASDRQAALNAMGDQLTTMLRGMDVAGQLSGPLDDAARVLATMPEFANTEWGQALGAVFSSPRAYAAYQIGQVKGVFEGGKEMVTGIISLAAKTIQYGVDNSMLGDAGDMARGLTGKMPGWLDEVIPSSQRGEASTAALHAMGKGIHNYLTTHTRGEVARDLGNALNKAWEGVKADHAAARAQGPEAEAEFLGRMTGRIGFEIAATFAGGVGIAGKAGKVGKVADIVADGARAADKVADGARVADKVADGGRAIGDGAKIAERGADGAQAINRAENVVASGAKQTAAITGTRAATSSIAIAAASKADDAAKLADVATDGARVAENAAKVADDARIAHNAPDDGNTVSKNGNSIQVAQQGVDPILTRARKILDDLPLNSRSLDDLYQAGKLTMDEARALARSVDWKDADGGWIYPPNNGFHNGFQKGTIKASDQLVMDRFGHPGGKFTSPLGESYTSRALPPGTQHVEYHVYKVESDLEAEIGFATPWFDEAGGAVQYRLSERIADLIFDGVLTEVKK